MNCFKSTWKRAYEIRHKDELIERERNLLTMIDNLEKTNAILASTEHIEKESYYLAEKDSFKKNSLEYWMLATITSNQKIKANKAMIFEWNRSINAIIINLRKKYRKY